MKILILFLSSIFLLISCNENPVTTQPAGSSIFIKGSIVGDGISYVNYGLDSIQVIAHLDGIAYKTFSNKYGDFNFTLSVLNEQKVSISAELTSFFGARIFTDSAYELSLAKNDSLDLGQIKLDKFANSIMPIAAGNYWEYDRKFSYGVHGAGGDCERSSYEGKFTISITKMMEGQNRPTFEYEKKELRTKLVYSFTDEKGECRTETSTTELLTESTHQLTISNGIITSDDPTFFRSLITFYPPDFSKWPFSYDSWNQDGPYLAVNEKLRNIYPSCSESNSDEISCDSNSGVRDYFKFQKNIGLLEYNFIRGGNFSSSSEKFILTDYRIIN